MAATAPQAEPISTPNITPLIDVLLVLLIMMILTIPAMTHKVSVDLPSTTTIAAPPMPLHKLHIAASGALELDGVAIAEAALPGLLAPIAADDTTMLTLDTDPDAAYGTVDRILATIKRGGVTRLGFAGHDRFANVF